jgi:predicted branched-subunit amino acid permease
MILTQLVINMRYALMSLSLSQKLDTSFTTPHRLAVSFSITDEIFAVASGKNGDINRRYMYGLALVPVACWVMGTLLGAAAGEILPERLKAALGIAIYGMFIAIFIPPARKSVGVLTVVVLSAALSCMFKYVPVFSGISEGFVVIICALVTSFIGAKFFPVKNKDGEEKA